MKKLALSLIALGISSYSFGALPATTDPTLVAVPLLPGGFFIGASALSLEPSANNSALDTISTNVGLTSFSSARVNENDLGYDWGWGLNVGYIFPQTGNDIQLNYWQLDNNKETVNLFSPFGGLNSFLVPFILINLTPGLASVNTFSASSTTNFDFDEVALTLGQYIDVGCRLILHPNVGVQYTKIDQESSSTFLGNIAVGVVGSSSTIANLNEFKSDFDGVGPRMGIDGSYYLGAGFGLVGHFNTALLIGNVDPRLTTSTAIGGSPVLSPTFNGAILQNTFNVNSDNRIVTNLGGKLGVDYSFIFNNAYNSYITLEVGYQVDEYFNALDLVRSTNIATLASTADPTIDTLALTSGTVLHQSADFGIHGPYANLTFYF